jgi:hypothetical protein
MKQNLPHHSVAQNSLLSEKMLAKFLSQQKYLRTKTHRFSNGKREVKN